MAKLPLKFTHDVNTQQLLAGKLPNGAEPLRYAGVNTQFEYQRLFVESYKQCAAVNTILLLMLVPEQYDVPPNVLNDILPIQRCGIIFCVFFHWFTI